MKSLSVLVDALNRAALQSGIVYGRRCGERKRRTVGAAELEAAADVDERIKAIRARAAELGDARLLELIGAP